LDSGIGKTKHHGKIHRDFFRGLLRSGGFVLVFQLKRQDKIEFGKKAMKLQSLLADIHALEEDLLAFERKYGVRSETFYAAYASGEEPEDDNWVLDFSEWASVYRTWLARQAEYRNEIQRVQRDSPSLAGFIHVVV
jgi:hypothetical protein